MYSTNAAGRFERKPPASVVAGAGRPEDNPFSEQPPFRRRWSVAMTTLYDFTVDDIHGKPVRLDRYKGKVVLVVNTPSECGCAPQYKGLEALYEKYKDRAPAIVGFPCNQFGAQEPGT